MHCVDLGESFPTSICLQNLASMHRERAYLISLILVRPRSFNFSRALPPGGLRRGAPQGGPRGRAARVGGSAAGAAESDRF